MRSLALGALTLVLMLSLVSIALARGAPPGKQKAFSSVCLQHRSAQAALMSETAGLNTLENQEPAMPRVTYAAVGQSEVVTTTRRGLSATVDWRGLISEGSYASRSGPQPQPVLRS